MQRRPIIKRLWHRIVLTEEGCWSVSGATTTDGYAVLALNKREDGTRKTVRAHRAVWQELVGPIPDGLVIDHLCEVRTCINPLHLRVCTQGENNARSGASITAVTARRTHCARGHEYEPDPYAPGKRWCPTCKAMGRRRRWQKNREANLAYAREWRARNAERVSEYNRRSYAKRVGA